MALIHLQRTILWISLLILTLFKFWAKNPQETLAIVTFILGKLVAAPRFFSRNIFIEKHSRKLERVLSQTSKLYKEYGDNFNPQDLNYYRKLEKLLNNKAQILYFIIRKHKPEIVVETGVAAGESTSIILQAIRDNKKGKLYSIDLPFQWYVYGNHKLHLDSLAAGQKPGYLIPERLKKDWVLTLGNTQNKLPFLLKKLKKIDIFFHDSEHTNKVMSFEYKTSWAYIKKGGYLLSDDVNYTNAFTRFSKRNKAKKIIFKDLGIICKRKIYN